MLLANNNSVIGVVGLLDFFAEFISVEFGVVRELVTPALDLFELGMDSLVSRRLVRGLDDRFGIDVSGRQIMASGILRDIIASILATAGQQSAALQKIPSQDAASESSATSWAGLTASVSQGQKGLWLLHQLNADSADYNVPLCFHLQGELDVDALQGACERLLHVHPALATRIVQVDGEPRQTQSDSAEFEFVHRTEAGLPREAVLRELRQICRKPFSLERALPVRFCLLSNATRSHYLLIVVHHIAFDAGSRQILAESIQETYSSLTTGASANVRPAATYFDFVGWEQSMLAGPEGRRHRDYWIGKLSGELPILEFPSGIMRRRLDGVDRSFVTTRLSGDSYRRILDLCRQVKATPAVVLLSVYQLLLHRYTGQKDIIVGVPTAGRPERQFDRLIGFFTNVVALRARFERGLKFSALTTGVKLDLAEALDHAAYPFPNVVKELNVRRESDASPVFQTAFEYDIGLADVSTRTANGAALRWKPVDGIQQQAAYPLVLDVVNRRDALDVSLKFDATLFEPSVVQRMLDHYSHLLEQAQARPDLAIDEFSLATDPEMRLLAQEWNDTARNYSLDECVHELVSRQANATPEAIALSCGVQHLNYRQLDRRAESIAAELQACGVLSNDLVGICVPRSVDLIVGMIAILKCGAAYLPLDPSHPPERLKFMLNDCGVRAVVTHASTRGILGLPEHGPIAELDIDSEWYAGDVHEDETSRVALRVATTQLAYVMYTSGSTGTPKGVMVSHRSLTNLLLAMQDRFKLGAQDKVLAITSCGFDISGLEFFLPLVTGGQCAICPTDVVRDGAELARTIANEQPTLMQATPTTWAMLFDSGWHNVDKMKMLCGGEALPERLRHSLTATGGEAWNLYGPTETTIWSTLQKLSADSPVSIGRPIANTRIYILDQYGHPCPIGVPGELCIAGAGVATGYRNRPELTAASFVTNALAKDAVVYRTGDIARWNPEGTIACLGRGDTQIKLHGHRIELGEIEARLSERPEVVQCVVVVVDRADDKQLVVFYVAKTGDSNNSATFVAGELRKHLREVLPAYMLPKRYIQLEAMPANANGKIDRRRLELWSMRNDAVANSPPDREGAVSDHRSRMLRAWKAVLQVDEVDVDSGFFEVGGDSLLAVRLAHCIRLEFGCEFSVTDVFKHATLRQATARVADLLGGDEPQLSRTDTSKRFQSAPHESRHAELSKAQLQEGNNEAVAIIGIACRFPGADNHWEFWRNLLDGVETIETLAGADASIVALSGGERLVRRRASIREKDCFDAAFFNLSPHDVDWMDPQQRLLLEESWHAVEDAGYRPDEIPNTAVFVSTSNNFFQAIAAGNASIVNLSKGAEQYQAWMLGQAGTIPSMISHRLGLQGPSVYLHSNCSSSLIGLHAALQSLRTHESDYALVGAAAVHLGDEEGYIAAAGLNFSATGSVKAFDAAADGMVPGEGVAVVLLKRAADAEADGDSIYGLIRAIAVNNDGSGKAGFYAPSVAGQTRVLEQALRKAQVSAASIGYVEAHGTGTLLGDPVELAALKSVYTQDTESKRCCGIGSVKTNIGHADTAAGLAGCIKTILSLRTGTIPPSLNFRSPNPELAIEASPFFVVDKKTAWPSATLPRRAAVSAFGIGGTNAHAILEQHIDTRSRASYKPGAEEVFLVPLSARNHERLAAYVGEMSRYLEAARALDVEPVICDLAYTLQVGRRAMASRVLFIVSSLAELREKLCAYVVGASSDDTALRGEVNDLGHVLSADDGVNSLVRRLRSARQFVEIGNAWTKGICFDWNVLYAGTKPRRICAPTYPFARERFALPRLGDVSKRNKDRTAVRESNWIDGLPASGDRSVYVMAFHRAWIAKPITDRIVKSFAGDRWLVVDERIAGLIDEVGSDEPASKYIALHTAGDTVDERIRTCSKQVFELLQDVLKSRPLRPQLIQIAIARPDSGSSVESSGDDCLAAISGLLKTATLENPKVRAQLIELDTPTSAERLLHFFAENGMRLDEQEICYRQGKRFVARWTPTAHLKPEAAIARAASEYPWHAGGVYLVSGGAGALGLLFAREIAKTAGTKIMLVGRSPASDELRAALADCSAAGAHAEYRAIDVCNESEVSRLVDDVLRRHGALNGVIQAAGLIQDSFLIKKHWQEFQAVLDPKITGTLNIDRATARVDLDFFLLFSSVSGALGNVGQGDYSVANAFLDRFASHRNALMLRGERSGRSVSVNWPLWARGGMQVDEATLAELNGLGFQSMENDQGLAAVQFAWSQGQSQMLVLRGEVAAVRSLLAMAADGADSSAPDPHAAKPDSLGRSIAGRIKKLIAEVTKLPIDRIDDETILASYGVDSLAIVKLNQRLGSVIRQLPKTVFFEYPTVAAIRDYCLDAHRVECARWVANEVSTASDENHDRVDATAESGKLTSRVISSSRSPAPPNLREPIAIIGLSGRYAGAENLAEYWELLKNGRDCIGEIPPERWSLEDFYEPDVEKAVADGKSYGKVGGFLAGFADFDPLFFGIAPREALDMDPQERLFLQACWEVLEDAGYTRDSIAKRHGGRVGVYAGVTKTGYELYGPALRKQGEQINLSTSFSSIANRVSYVFDFRGPSMPIDTMCSASLTAIHEACEHLLRGECEVAIAGGVNLYLHPATYFNLCALRMLSPSGKCKAFATGADGFVPGEGVGAVLLKPLRHAVVDADHIYAVIRGTSINHGGKTNGFTVPSPRAQREVVAAAMAKSQVSARTISYIEAHGTGTELGDPIEVAGLSQAFRQSTADKQFCAIGSVKTNIGHLEAAAGIAGLTKVLLQMQHRLLVPSLDAERPNPNIEFSTTPFIVQQECAEWKRPMISVDGEMQEYPRIAGVNSFGAGGSNAHLIVEEFSADRSPSQSALPLNTPALIVLSAKHQNRLAEQVRRLLSAMDSGQFDDADLADIAYTLQTGREAMEHRLALTAGTLRELSAKLREFLADGKTSAVESCFHGDVRRHKELLLGFNSEPDVKSLVGRWLRQGKYDRVLSLWSNGLSVEWQSLYDEGSIQTIARLKRVSLPTYPFARERYWISGGSQTDVDVGEDQFPLEPTVGSEHCEVSMPDDSPLDGETFADELSRKMLSRLKQLFGAAAKLEVEKIAGDERLGSYGIDSIMITRMNAQLAEKYGELSKALFYEYPTLQELSSYLVSEHRGASIRWAGLDEPQQRFKSNHASPRKRELRSSQPRRELMQPSLFAAQTDIAIIGVSGRYGNTRTVDEYWEMLKSGATCITEIPSERWPLAGFFEANVERAVAEGKSYSKWGAFVEGFDEFDSLFFGISPQDAAHMDPQERLFLQCAHATLEDAGYTKERLAKQHQGRVGVYVGVTRTGFDLHNAEARKFAAPLYPLTSFGSIANRVSFALDLHGPSLPIDTMCSASLTAIHEACEHLKRGECEIAIAGGVNLYLHPSSYAWLAALRMLSRGSECRSFAAGGDGFVPGEGVGAVLLKPLSRALDDGDRIDAVIKGTSINHGGRTAGYTVPNPNAQSELIEAALKNANVDARLISYVEAHGTGTELGDPIEIAGLVKSFGRYTTDVRYCALGSAKSNIGHLEAAAGIAGLTKVLLQMRHRTLVPSLHAQAPNPHIDFARTPFRLQDRLEEWRRPILIRGDRQQEYPRTAGISAFGAGGANAHVIVAEYDAPIANPVHSLAPARPALIVLSAKSEDRLKAAVALLVRHLRKPCDRGLELDDIAYTLQVSRDAMDVRLALTAATIAELCEKLSRYLHGEIAREGMEDCFQGDARTHKDALSIFAGDEALRQAIATWLEQGQYRKLLELWTQGLSFDWSRLYENGSVQAGPKPRRVRLPTYPFARDRYWTQRTGLEVAISAPPAVDAAVDRLISVEEWVEHQVEKVGECASPEKVVLVLLADGELRAEFGATVKRIDPGAKVVFAIRGSAVIGDQCYSVDDSPESYEKLLSRVALEHGEPRAAICCWGLERAASLDEFDAVLPLIQALSSSTTAELRIVIVGEYASEIDRCYAESWIGYERSLRRMLSSRISFIAVHAERQGSDASGSVEEKAPRDSRWMDTWVRRIWAELGSDSFESVLYIRDSRHVLRTRQVEPQATGVPVFRHGGTYLIIGGLGALGFACARHLAKRYAARLILTGRTPLDDGKHAQLATLANLGARTLYIRVDVSDAAQMQAELGVVQEQFGAIHGVLHAAGVAGNGVVLGGDRSQFQAVLTPKIAGTLVLDRILGDASLDFVCYFSSTSAVLGDFGACDYSIANRFQMAYARHRNAERASGRRRGITLAICWPLWANGGMRFSDEAAQRLYLESSGQRALGSEEAMGFLEELLGQHEVASASHSIVLVGDRSRLPALLKSGSGRGISALTGDAARTRAAVRPELQGLTIGQCVLWDLKEQLSQLLKLTREQLERGRNLADYGVDSISLAQFAQRLAGLFQMEVLPSLFFSHPTLEQLAKYFAVERKAAMELIYLRDAGSPLPPDESATLLRVESELSSQPRDDFASIAIVGMSGRFPKARGIGELWRLLAGAEEAIEAVSPTRFDRQDYSGTSETRWLGAMPGVDEFDPLFFEISPSDAEHMDPRQRLLLQESFKALEDADYCGDRLSAQRIGVFVGAEQGEYGSLLGNEGNITASHDAMLAARLAYFLNLHGPVMTLNTSCSSALVAVHQACLSLRSGECDAAIAAGVNVILTAQSYVEMSRAGMLSADGKCRAFDRRASGMVPGEAVAAVVLKRLSSARADGDRIHAVIRGSGINYDGKTNGITAPSGIAQTELINAVYARTRLKAQDIGYLIAHGTGTRLGDPIEINALNEVFKSTQVREPACALTSIKPNIGHTFAASGLVSLIALVEAIRHETIPASLHCEELSDYIDWSSSAFYVNRSAKPWPKNRHGNRIGAVSAFGMSGTNAHVVIASDDVFAAANPAVRAKEFANVAGYLLAISAKSENSLRQRALDLIELLKSDDRSWDAPAMASLSYALLNHRQHFAWRSAFVVNDREHALLMLGKSANCETLPTLSHGRVPRDFHEQPVLKQHAEELLLRLELLTEPISYRQSLAALGELYCQGYRLDWRSLYRLRPQHISLPTYPFDNQRYWIQQSAKEGNNATEAALEHDVIQANDVQDQVTRHLRAIVSKVTKLEMDRLDSAEPLASYGIDSLMIVKLNELLAGVFGDLSKTLFYEYPTLADLGEYLAAEYREQCEAWVGAATGPRLKTSERAEPRRTAAIDARQRIVTESARGAKPNVGDIAIIGVSGRYPQARNLDEYWENLRTGRECIEAIPEERWDLAGFFEANIEAAVEQGKSYCKAGGFVDGFAEFDALFFGIAPRDAANMDPQERLFLQASWEATESAGYTRERIARRYQGRVGVFVGISKTGFDLHGAETKSAGEPLYPLTSFSSVANRVSYFMDWHGPSLSIDTMCSASLTAIHEACECIKRGECEMAIAGGVNLYLHPSAYVGLCAQRMLSPDEECRSFGLGGNGFVPGEGVGAMLLKPLARAVADCDCIHGVVRATNVNHGGKTNGYTVPNPKAQSELIATTLRKAGLDARLVSYVEAHGTGTELGDPIEISGLTQAFATYTAERQFCAIGSVKTNIGHLEAAAGIAGLTKVLLQMKHRQLVPSLHSQRLNPHIDFACTPFQVQQTLSDWERPRVMVDGQLRECPRIAAVSSFGAGGVNAHALVEEYVAAPSRPDASRQTSMPVLVVLSAKNEARLQAQANQLLAFSQSCERTESDLADIAYTLQVGREAMEHRLAFSAESLGEMVEKLSAYIADRGKDLTADYFHGEVRHGRDSLAIVSSDADGQALIEAWLAKGKHSKVMELWVRGLPIDWNKLREYAPPRERAKPRRISLPTYPFARDRYWTRRRRREAVPDVEANVRAQLSRKALDEIVDDCVAGRISTDVAAQLTARLRTAEQP